MFKPVRKAIFPVGGIVMVFGAPQIVAWVRGLFGV